MKRKLFLMTIAAVSAFVMVACGSKSSSNTESAKQAEVTDEEDVDEADAPKTAEGVIAMLRAAYEEVNLFTNPSGEDDCEPNIDLCAEYCTKEFNDLREQMREIDVKKGETGIIDDWNGLWSFWDEGTITPKDFDVTVDGDTADAIFELTNGGESVTYDVSLIYVDGQWRVSDWTQRGLDGLSILERMKEYVEENK